MNVKGFFDEFKQFAIRGNVVDLAVGLILGAGFNSIVKSLVDNVVMPPIGLLLGRIDFSNLYIQLGEENYDNLAAAREAGAPVIAYGQFLNEIVTFTITAFVVFLLIRQMNRWQNKKGEGKEAEANERLCPYCCSSISKKATRCPNCTSQLKKKEA